MKMDVRIGRLLACLPPPLACELRRMEAGNPALFEGMGELRLRAGRLAVLSLFGRQVTIPVRVEEEALIESFRALCGESVYLQESFLREGFFSFEGMRVGVAGRAVTEDGLVVGVAAPRSLCIRIPHRVRGAGDGALRHFLSHGGRAGMLIYSPPGVGKTTLLADLSLSLATGPPPREVTVIDTRGELSDPTSCPAAHMDLLTGYPIAKGVLHATRSLCPDVILCDELGTEEEAEAILSVAGCGVPLVATAHAGTRAELVRRPPIRRLLEAGIFPLLFGISRCADGYDYVASEWGGEGKVCSALQAQPF